MNATWVYRYRTPSTVRLDLPIDATVNIPLHKGRIAMQGVAGIAIIAVSLRALLFGFPGIAHQMNATSTFSGSLRLLAIVAATVFGMLGGAAILLRSFHRLQDAEPGLSVGPRGIRIRSENTAPRNDTIPWTAIRSLERREYRRRPYIAVHLVDPQRFTSASSLFTALIARLNHRIAGSAITISPQWLQISMIDLETLLRRYFEQYASLSASEPERKPLDENRSRSLVSSDRRTDSSNVR